MSEALGMGRDDATFLEAFTEGQREETQLRGLAGALQRHEWAVPPEQRRDFDGCDCTTPHPIAEPTGQYALVVSAADEVFVRVGHRWYQAGVSTTEPIPWPDIRPVRVVSWGES